MQGEAGAAAARRRARGVRRHTCSRREISAKKGTNVDAAARPDSAPGRNPRPQGESEPARDGHGRRSAARSGQGSGRDGARAERHAQGRRRLHLRHVLGPRARAARRARQAREGGRSGDSGADPRLPGRSDGGRSVARRRGRDGGARDRAAPRASRSRSEEPSRQRAAASRSRTSWRRRRRAARARCNIVIKADQGGPAEALADALHQLSHERSARSKSSTAASARSPRATSCSRKASGAIIIGFHVRPDNNARTAAEREGVEIKLYRIIYEAVADVRAALEGMLRPEEREVVLGEAEVREMFKVSQHRHRSPAARFAAA